MFRGRAGEGHEWAVPLSRAGLLPLDVLTQYCSGNEYAARGYRREMEENLFEAFLRETLQPGTRLLDPGGTQAFVTVFTSEEGFLYPDSIASMIDLFGGQSVDPIEDDEPTNNPILPEPTNENITPGNDGEDTIMEDASESSWPDGDGNEETRKEGQSLLNMLYHIAEEQARRDGYLHRGVSCNSCNASPIRGIRYRCANCADYDLCEQCETMQVHPRTHIFYKIRIPAPAFGGSTRQAQAVPYPGRPGGLPNSFPKEAMKEFTQESGLGDYEVEGLWDQFKCMANTDWPEDDNGFGMAINREAFDKCFIPGTSTIRPPPSSLIHDRIFAFYDTNADGLIGFYEFTMGIATMRSKNASERIKRMFRGYDHDGDGFVSRKDFLRMFRAYYALNKEYMHDMVAAIEEEIHEGTLPRDNIMGSQSISSAYTTSIPYPERSRAGEGKQEDRNGDLNIVDDGDIVADNGSDRGDQDQIIGDLSEIRICGDLLNGRRSPSAPRLEITADANNARESQDDFDNIREQFADPNVAPEFSGEEGLPDHSRSHNQPVADLSQRRQDARRSGIDDRRERYEFYLDDVGDPAMTWAERRVEGSISAAEDSRSRFPNGHSEPSRSTNRQRRTSIQGSNARISASFDTAASPEILYQIIQEGLNELLDPIFKQREDLAIEVVRNNHDFIRYKNELAEFGSRKMVKLCGLQLNMLQAQWRTTDDDTTLVMGAGTALRLLVRKQYTEHTQEYDINRRMMKRLGLLKFEGPPQYPTEEERGSDSISEGKQEPGRKSDEFPTELPEDFDVPTGATSAINLLRDTEAEKATISQDSAEEESQDHPTSHSDSTTSPGLSTPPPPPEYPAAALELHEGVSAFNEADTGLEESISQQTLEQLLKSAGYSTVDDDDDPGRHRRSQSPSPESTRSENTPDPTMPQNRPNSIASPLSASADNDDAISPPNDEEEKTAPSERKLKYLLMLLLIRWQDNGVRHGPGKISFSEFRQIMEGPKGLRLGFLGSWIDMQNL